ncbi:MAG: GH3 auxin-responsive promoter family protein, partial [Gammaproteobacteria bacterium]|nr:GH3 auxin-responsive promoter family protein [Gammaproteobacteria bacterium]
TGRTKHFLSLCGEHLSVENMNRAIELVGDDLNININEFAVAGVPHKSLFAHHWFIGTDDDVDKDEFREKLDNHLKDLNDDYKVERKAALKDVIVDVLPNHIFIDFLAHIGKKGGQNKFPRVLKGKQLVEWEEFIKDI